MIYDKFPRITTTWISGVLAVALLQSQVPFDWSHVAILQSIIDAEDRVFQSKNSWSGKESDLMNNKQ
jgi:hypothetical protein